MATATLRPRQVQELDLTLERERRWLIDHIGALEALSGGGEPVAQPDASGPVCEEGSVPEESQGEADVPALNALIGVLARYLAAELAPEDIRVTLNRVYHERLDEIDDALGRIGRGTYGVCEECGGTIYAPRLERIPWTRHCRQCAERLAKEGIHAVTVPSTAAATDVVVEYGLAKSLLG
jgi:hypothetical protein